ncbi:DUF4186 domain-containing protein [Methylobacterium sp. E-016]|uniref:DUF4186 family protein n=1 Tax=Methylobacterium sp. E-016 TaxID=2836556 RepID=UPI001FBB9D08|nr:DUF4186 family protein [Methylobacterium sp. E-016]MCJ2075984.1 DUF4186 domain-containing protein [Methylobacterium sp. E-016]
MSDPFAELDVPVAPIKVTCTTTDCANDLHCYLQKRKVEGAHVFGPCRSCGEPGPFSIERITCRDIDDVGYTFPAMRHEMIRETYWSKPFDEKALARFRKKGRDGLLQWIPNRVRSSIGRAANGFDGRQTGLEGNVVYYAQHATATCCRKCVSYWHGIPADRDLTPEEAQYCEALIVAYLDARWSSIDPEP